jgi:hypothetical protein
VTICEIVGGAEDAVETGELLGGRGVDDVGAVAAVGGAGEAAVAVVEDLDGEVVIADLEGELIGVVDAGVVERAGVADDDVVGAGLLDEIGAGEGGVGLDQQAGAACW